MSGMLQMDFSLLAGNLVRSIIYGVSPEYNFAYTLRAQAHLGAALIPVVAAVGIVTTLLAGLATKEASPAGWRDAFLVMAVGFGAVVPTALIESVSTIWTIGTRWRMVEQAWVPLFWLSFLAVIAALLPLGPRAKHWLLASGTGIAAAVALSFSLGHNAAHVERGTVERGLKKGLTAYAEHLPRTFTVLVLATNTTQATLESLPKVANPLWFGPRDAEARLLRPGAASGPAVVMRDDRAIAARADGSDVPWELLRIVRFDGKQLSIPTELNAADFAGFQVIWERSSPILQTP